MRNIELVNGLINQLTAMNDLSSKIPQESLLSKEVLQVCINIAQDLQRLTDTTNLITNPAIDKSL